jgi:aromatic ring-opening dioxygenase LigB subunit
MALVYACIAAHGSELIPRLASSKKIIDLFRPTHLGMRALAREIKKRKPATIIVASPHNLRLWKKICIVLAENSSGVLNSGSRKNQVSLHAKCDFVLARDLYQRAIQSGLPVVGANFGTSEGSGSNIPMDWGTLVPLRFVLKNLPGTRIAMVTPSREIPLEQNRSLGRLIADCCKARSEDIVFIASADQPHAYTKSGPYGFHKAARLYDELVLQAIKENDMKSIMKLDTEFVEDAKPDSLWQLAILAGVLDRIDCLS